MGAEVVGRRGGTEQQRLAALRAWRLYRAVVREWTNVPPHVPAPRHQLRVQRQYSVWPGLARALDGLAETVLEHSPDDLASCAQCGAPVERVHGDVDPRTATHSFRLGPCNHLVDREVALDAWRRGADPVITPINGSTLAAAERQRQRGEEGHTIDHDLETHGGGELSWAAFCLLDAASPDAHPRGEPPAVWPWGKTSWARFADKAPLRLVIIAAALLQADIDRRLAAGETLAEEAP